MKQRNGFVSNSSSSSFIVDLTYVSARLLKEMRHPVKTCKERGWDDLGAEFFKNGDACRLFAGEMFVLDWMWVEDEKNKTLTVDTNMDNFDMENFFLRLGVPPEAFRDRYHSNG